MAYHRTVREHSAVVRSEHLIEVQDKLMLVQREESDLKNNFALVLPKIRSGQASSHKVWQLVEDTLSGDAAPGNLLQVTDEYGEKSEFISMAMNRGAEYLLVTGPAMQTVRKSVPNRGTSYVFFFSNEAMH